MSAAFKEYKSINFAEIGAEVLHNWQKNHLFEQSISKREGRETFVFYEGPPSANGLPGIHHVMARTIKDIFCRYKTLQGYQVQRKAGWDTHGLPVELGVEQALGIKKDDIGEKISVEDYNAECRKSVMQYTDVWNNLTEKIGFWVDMNHPYVTYDNKYIESVWYLLKQLFDKELLYKGYSIQPFSPAAGTGLSSHELNQPGTYRDVKDTTVVAQFKIIQNEKSQSIFEAASFELFALAWTTTPWTLPSNTALAVGPKIKYTIINTVNQYTKAEVSLLLAEDLVTKHFSEKAFNYDDFDRAVAEYKAGKVKVAPAQRTDFSATGKDLLEIKYEQLLPYAQPIGGDGFRIIPGNFVTTEDGTGLVHIAPSFGADDQFVAKEAGIGYLTLVDRQGRFTAEVTDFAGEFVKEDYLDEADKGSDYKSVDVRIAIKLKEENKAFKVEKYEHSYPHCWRTDKPILYYPLDSWFVKTTAHKQRMIELNETIKWKPASTGSGRFGNWLENLQDWNLSRSRFWGIPIPIWSSEDGSERLCIGSVGELKAEIEKAVAAGVMKSNPLEKFTESNFSKENYQLFDLHKPYVDEIVLVSPKGTKLTRESDLIDVWFDSGAMPYAQWHYPFENKESFEKNFPADFIAEGVDQTRGWFFTLHAIATMCFDSVAYRTVVSNGLVLDKNGQKMSKRLGNAIDPFETIDKYGADITRWYMISNAQPWDNLRFDVEGLVEVQRKFFRALSNSYSFFALYANIDQVDITSQSISLPKRPEIDRWILSKLNSLIKDVASYYDDYEPTKAARALQEFVVDHLSNWYVRLCRRRFWKGELNDDKQAAYQTLYECLIKVAQLASPIAPFFCDRLFCDLNEVSKEFEVGSVHLSDFCQINVEAIDIDLEERMGLAQLVSSLVLSLRKKEEIKVRQPLGRIMIPAQSQKVQKQISAVKELILSEVNVKDIEFMSESENIIQKKIVPNFKALGPKFKKEMKEVTAAIRGLSSDQITRLEAEKKLTIPLAEGDVEITIDDVEILSEDIPGWLVASENSITVALDITVTANLKEEGISRELVNRIQNLRKDSGLEVTDRIKLQIQSHEGIDQALKNNESYICEETLANSFEIVDSISGGEQSSIEIDEKVNTKIAIFKI